MKLPEVYQRLLAINGEAHALASYQVAYHALAAALHAANDDHDEPGVLRVKKLAEEQIEWIDTHDSAHPVATASAAERGHASVYAMLAQQAKAMALMLRRPHHAP